MKKALFTLVSSSLSTVEHYFPQCLLCQHRLVHLNHAPQIRFLHIPVWEIQYFGTYFGFSPGKFKKNVMTRNKMFELLKNRGTEDLLSRK